MRALFAESDIELPMDASDGVSTTTTGEPLREKQIFIYTCSLTLRGDADPTEPAGGRMFSPVMDPAIDPDSSNVKTDEAADDDTVDAGDGASSRRLLSTRWYSLPKRGLSVVAAGLDSALPYDDSDVLLPKRLRGF